MELKFMIEVIASFDYAEPSKPDGFVKGNILFFDYSKNVMDTDENMYTDKYSFALYVMRKFWNKGYKWNSINIHFENCVVKMKGENNKRIEVFEILELSH